MSDNRNHIVVHPGAHVRVHCFIETTFGRGAGGNGNRCRASSHAGEIAKDRISQFQDLYRKIVIVTDFNGEGDFGPRIDQRLRRGLGHGDIEGYPLEEHGRRIEADDCGVRIFPGAHCDDGVPLNTPDCTGQPLSKCAAILIARRNFERGGRANFRARPAGAEVAVNVVV